MAMPPGSVVIPDKMQFPAAATGGGAAGGNEMVHQQQQHHHHRHQWFALDERDGFISWLRGEFAAANAIIDSLCHHLRSAGEPGEYDLVIGSIQQRRCNWNHVLHMQQYFSIVEVLFALQQVALRKQQQQQQQQQPHHRYYYDQPKVGGKEFRRSSGVGFSKGQRGGEVVKEVTHSNVENYNVDGTSSGNVGVEKLDEVKFGDSGEKLDDKVSAHADNKKEATVNPHAASQPKCLESSEGNSFANAESEVVDVNDQSSHREEGSHSIQDKNDKENLIITPKTFVGSEIIDGKMVNIVDGLKLYDQFLNDSEVLNLVSLVNELRAAGRKGQLQGQTYVVSKRPMKGHGREMIQFGTPIADAPFDDENTAGTSKERKIESVPSLLQDVIEHLVGMHVMPVKPDSCIINIYNEGDHSQPYMCPPWFGKPISVLFLTECDMTFGRVIVNDHPGDYRGSFKLTLAPGSVLAMQGKSSDFSKHALPAVRKQRILVTFTKSLPKKFAPSDGLRLHSTAVGHSSHWGPPPSRSPNHIRHSVPSRSPNHYCVIPVTGVLPAPPIRPQMPPPNGVQPLFVTAPVAAPMPFPAPVPMPPASTGWPAAPPRHPPSRLPVPPPGTGVFLPPSVSGNGSSPTPLSTTGTETNLSTEAAPQPERDNGSANANHGGNNSPKDKFDGKAQRQDCNGTVDGRSGTKGEKNPDHAVGSDNESA